MNAILRLIDNELSLLSSIQGAFCFVTLATEAGTRGEAGKKNISKTRNGTYLVYRSFFQKRKYHDMFKYQMYLFFSLVFKVTIELF